MMNLYPLLLDVHSLLRWLIVLLMVAVALKSLVSWIKKYEYGPFDDRLAVFTVIFVHVQFLIGLILYFISPIVQSGLRDMAAAMKSADLRFWTVEHSVGMLAAVVLATVGRAVSRRKKNPLAKHRVTAIYFILSLVIMIAMIPWERV